MKFLASCVLTRFLDPNAEKVLLSLTDHRKLELGPFKVVGES